MMGSKVSTLRVTGEQDKKHMHSVAAAIAGAIDDDGAVKLRAMGRDAISVTVKAIATAGYFVQKNSGAEAEVDLVSTIRFVHTHSGLLAMEFYVSDKPLSEVRN